MRIAYLSCEAMLDPASSRKDAFEHGLMLHCLRKAATLRGVEIFDLAWDEPRVFSESWDAVLVGTAWDYQDRQEEFLSAMEDLSRICPLYNPPELLRWNSRKTYLRDLTGKGFLIVPTLFLESLNPEDLKDACQHFGTETLVVKRQVGANAEGQHLWRMGALLPDCQGAVMVQPFLQKVRTEGELSFIFIGERFSHALRKLPKEGDYRVQSAYGGREQVHVPDSREMETARGILESLEPAPVYARMDFVQGEKDRLHLMELELVEPYLYPEQGPELGNFLLEEILRRG